MDPTQGPGPGDGGAVDRVAHSVCESPLHTNALVSFDSLGSIEPWNTMDSMKRMGSQSSIAFMKFMGSMFHGATDSMETNDSMVSMVPLIS